MIGLLTVLALGTLAPGTLAKAPSEASGHAKCVATTGPVLARVTGPGGQEAFLTPGALHIMSTSGERVITRCDGLPGGHPLSLVATNRDLVIGFRDAGAQRFDGTEFSPIEGLPRSPIRALAFGKRADLSALWIGTGSAGLWVQNGMGVSRHPHRVLGKRGITALAYRGGVLHVGSDPQGHWRLSEVTAADVVQERVVRLSKEPVGCFATGKRIVVRPPGLRCMGPAGSQPHVTAMIRHKKKLLIATFDQGLVRKRGKTFRSVANSPRFINTLLSVGSDLYIGSAVGLFRWRGKTIERVPLGLPSEHINALAVSKTGTIWIATSRGVASLENGRVRLLTRAHGLPSRIVYSVAVTDDDALWVGTAGGAVRILGDETTVYSQEKGSLPHDWVTSLWAHGDDVYAGTYNSGVARLSAHGESRPLAGLEHTWVNPAGLSLVDGALAIATLGDGLWFHDGVTATRAPRLPSNDVTAILRDGDELWVGTRGGLATLMP